LSDPTIRMAVVGNVSIDRVDGGEATPGGCPSFAALGLCLLGRREQVVTRLAEPDRFLFEEFLGAFEQHTTLLDGSATCAFDIQSDGDSRRMSIVALGDPWSTADAAAVLPDVTWVHVAPLTRSDFSASTLQALGAGGRHLSYDGQGLVRVARTGHLMLDANFDPAVLAPLHVLKLAEDEAAIVGGGRFDRGTATMLGVPEVLVTLGSRGSIVYARGHETYVTPDEAVLGVPTTGTGDLFMVGYVAARERGAEPVEAARVGSALVTDVLLDRRDPL
jgi:sugar/nucleoside kinase (ribokinase family)